MTRALLAIVLCACSTGPVLAPASPVKVVRVIDGDSLDIESDGERVELRLAGVNAPERGECLGEAAATVLGELTSAGPLTMRRDGEDQFGRSLGDLFAGGISVSEQMVSEGMAIVVSGPGDDHRFVLQDRARQNGLGIWSESVCGATGPVPPVAILAMTANPPGPDEADLDGETVTVGNTGIATVDLSGWILRDESTANRFTFPAGTRLQPGKTITISSGCGGRELSWCSEGPVWNNGGDTALLVEPSGRIVDLYRHRP